MDVSVLQVPPRSPRPGAAVSSPFAPPSPPVRWRDLDPAEVAATSIACTTARRCPACPCPAALDRVHPPTSRPRPRRSGGVPDRALGHPLADGDGEKKTKKPRELWKSGVP